MTDLTVVDQVLEELHDQTYNDKPLRADLDLAELRIPGVWVQLRSVEAYTLDNGDAVNARLVAIVEEKDPRRAYTALLELYSLVKAALGAPDDGATFVTVNTPDGPALPGLAIPYQLVP